MENTQRENTSKMDVLTRVRSRSRGPAPRDENNQDVRRFDGLSPDEQIEVATGKLEHLAFETRSLEEDLKMYGDQHRGRRRERKASRSSSFYRGEV